MAHIATLHLISDEENPNQLFSVELLIENPEEDRISTLAELLAVGIRLSLNDPEFIDRVLAKLDQYMGASADCDTGEE